MVDPCLDYPQDTPEPERDQKIREAAETLTKDEPEKSAEVAKEDRQQNKSCAKSCRLDVSARFALTNRP